MWAEYTWRKQGSIIKQVTKEDPIRKRLLGKPKLIWEDCVKKRC